MTSPPRFFSADVAAYLVRACDAGRATQRRFLTAANVVAIEGGYLDPDGVGEFAAAGFEIRSVRNLHAKVLLTDDRWGLVGSGNLTVAGANGGNAELGIALSTAQTRIARRDHFDRWWRAGQPLDLKWMRAIEVHLSAVEERDAAASLTMRRVSTFGPLGRRARAAAIGSRSSTQPKTG